MTTFEPRMFSLEAFRGPDAPPPTGTILKRMGHMESLASSGRPRSTRSTAR